MDDDPSALESFRLLLFLTGIRAKSILFMKAFILSSRLFESTSLGIRGGEKWLNGLHSTINQQRRHTKVRCAYWNIYSNELACVKDLWNSVIMESRRVIALGRQISNAGHLVFLWRARFHLVIVNSLHIFVSQLSEEFFWRIPYQRSQST
jgi:hypothetical protein